MSFLGAMQADRPSRERCTIWKILAELDARPDPTLAADVRAALALSKHVITGAAIARLLVDQGFDVSEVTLNRHRRGSCACSRRGA